MIGAPGPARPRPVWRVEVTGGAADRPVRDLVLLGAATGAAALQVDEIEQVTASRVCDEQNTPRADSACTPQFGPYARTETSPPAGQQDVDDAFDNANTVAAFYANLGVALDTTQFIGASAADGVALRATVRHCDAGEPCPMGNAYWDGSRMYYGEGYASALDVVGHEMTHGVTQHLSGLVYAYQSGAINESMSDVMGELADQTQTPDPQWQLGENLPGGPIRSMADPTAYGQPDSMTSSLYTADPTFQDNGGVHTNSGVGNKAAYLIAQDLGIDKTARIYLRTEQLLSSGADYADLAADLVAACQQLVGTAGITAADCDRIHPAETATRMDQQPTTPGAAAPESPFCGRGQYVVPVFTDGMDTPATRALWTGGGGGWGFDPTNATSRQDSLLGTTPAGAAAPSTRTVVLTRSFWIPRYVPTYLHFAHEDQFDVDSNRNYDGGRLLYSVDAGRHWSNAGPLFTADGVRPSALVKPGSPVPAFRGFSGRSAGWVSSRASLAALAGRTVRFAFAISGDRAVSSGWWVDDVRIYYCSGQLPTQPQSVTASGLIGGVTVSWAPPVLHGPTPLTGYQVTLSPGGRSVTLPVTARRVSFGRLPPATYSVRVRALSRAGPGGWRLVVVAPTALRMSRSPAVVRRGRPVTFAGRLTEYGRPLAGRTVVLLYRRPGTASWRQVGIARTTSTGGYVLRLRVRVTGDYQARFVGGPFLLGAVSPALRTRVR